MNGLIGGDTFIALALMLVLKIGPVVLGVAAALWLLPRLPLGRALLGRAADSNDNGQRLLALEVEIARLREELAEVQERQDFSERLLSPDRPLPPRSEAGSPASTPREVTPVR